MLCGQQHSPQNQQHCGMMKLAALEEDFPPEPDRIHLSNGTLFLDGTFVRESPKLSAIVSLWPTTPTPRNLFYG